MEPTSTKAQASFGARPSPVASSRDTILQGLPVCLATGVILYLNPWIRLALIPGDVEYHLQKLRFQQVLLVTTFNSLAAAFLLVGIWLVGARLRNRTASGILQLFVVSLFALAILRSIVLFVPGTGQFGVDLGNVWLVGASLCIATLVQLGLNEGSSLHGRFVRIVRPVSIIAIAMLAALIVPVFVALGRDKDFGDGLARAGLLELENSDNTSRTSRTPSIIWIVLDEFDASVAFEHRPKSMKLPHIDQFRRQSISFRYASSPSGYTVTAVPSLLTGIPFTRVVRKEVSDLILATTEASREYSFRDTPNVIHWANGAGVPVSVVGWSHPYCRVFGDKLVQCAWYENAHMSSAQTWAVSVRELEFRDAVFAQMWQEGRGMKIDPCIDHDVVDLASVGLTNYRASIRGIVDDQRIQVRKFLQSGVGGLRIFHLATPHPPGATEFTETISSTPPKHGTAIAENYAIADSIFGEIRSILEDREEWDSSLVILTSDHGLRSFWQDWGCLSEEDREVLQNRDEFHVPLMLKWPGGKEAVSVERPVSTMIIAPLVRAYLERRLQTSDEFTAYLNQHVLVQDHTNLSERSASR